MCFRIDPRYPNELVAEKDLVCYKYMRKKGEYFCSPIYPTKWLPGVLIKARGQNVLAVDMPFGLIRAGIHSFKLIRHAACDRVRDEILVECKIPKGSRYYKNATEYVSDRIIIVKEVK